VSIQGMKDQLFGKKNKGSMEETLYVLMKEFGYTYQELVGEEIRSKNVLKIFGIPIAKWETITIKEGLPMPTFSFLIEFLTKESKANQRAMKSKSGKGRR